MGDKLGGTPQAPSSTLSKLRTLPAYHFARDAKGLRVPSELISLSFILLFSVLSRRAFTT